jgi:hypothetical protein
MVGEVQVARAVLTNPTVLKFGSGVITGLGASALWNSVTDNGNGTPVVAPNNSTSSSTTNSTVNTNTTTNTSSTTNNLSEVQNDNRISNLSLQMPDYNIVTNSPYASISTSKKSAAAANPDNGVNTYQKPISDASAETKTAVDADADSKANASAESGLTSKTILTAVAIGGLAYVLGELFE